MRKAIWFYVALFVVLIFVLYYKRREISENEELASIDSVLSETENFIIGGFNQVMGRFDEIYQKWGQMRGIDWRLIKAVAKHESNENPNAVGDGGQAIGLMQLWYYHWGVYSREEMFDPDHNVEQGSQFLGYLVNKYGTEPGVQMFNAGESGYLKGVRVPEYLASVMSNFEAIG